MRYTLAMKPEQAGWLSGFWVGAAVGGLLAFILGLSFCLPSR
jgi:tetrahydromethanopterin S-methyltransferase subunit B